MFIKLIFSILLLFIYSFNSPIQVNGRETQITSTPFQKCWNYPEVNSSLVASDNISSFFLENSQGQIKNINSLGKENWNLELGGETISKPIYLNGTLYILSRTDSIKSTINIQNIYSVAAVNSLTGLVRWRMNFNSITIPFLILYKENPAIIFTRDNVSELILIDSVKGSTLLENRFNFVFSKFYGVSKDLIVFENSRHQVGFLSISEGKVKSADNNFKSFEIGSVNSEFAMLADANGSLYLLNFLGNITAVKIRLGGKISSIIFYENKYLISSHDNFLYLFSKDAKKIIWKKRFAGRIIEKPIISQDVFIAFSQGDNSVYFISPEDGKTLNQINLPEGEEISSSPIILGDLILVNTSAGISAYSSSKCGNRTNTES